MRGIGQELLRPLAAAAGLEVGPGTEVRLVLEAFPAGGLGLLTAVGLLLLLLAGPLALRRLAPAAPPLLRAAVAVLRGLALLLPALVLLGPSLITINRKTIQGTTLVLVDSSWSMRRADPGAPAPRHAAVDRLLGGAFLGDLARRNRVRVLAFDGGVRPHPWPGNGSWTGIVPLGSSTNLARALERIAEEERSGRVAAAIVLTDGRGNEGGPPEAAARLLRERQIPLHLVGVGDPSPRPAAAVASLDAPERVSSRDPFRVVATVEAEPGVDAVVLSLRERLAGGAEREIASRRVELAGGRGRAEIEVRPEEPGLRVLRAVARPEGGGEEGEAQAVLDVDARPARVLLLAGTPSYEYRALRDLLTRDRTVDLSCWLQSADRNFPQDGNTPLAGLPREEGELKPFHAVVLIDPDPEGLDLLFSRNLAHAVRAEGAGLAFVAGEVFTRRFLSAPVVERITGPLVDLLPARPDQPVAEVLVGLGRPLERPWPLEPTPQGLRDRLLALGEDAGATRLLWASLPGMYWNYPFRTPAPGAHVLLVHPGPEPLHRSAEGPRPVLAWHHAGVGRVLLATVDETWRWWAVAETAWARFWVRSVRFLGEAKLLGDPGVHQLRTDRRRYEPGAEVLLLDRPPLGTEPRPLPATVGREGEAPAAIRLEPVPERPGELEARLEAGEPGLYEARIPNLPGAAPAWFEVQPPRLESPGPMAETTLKRLASLSGGTYRRLGEADSLTDLVEEAAEEEVHESRPRPLWDNGLLLALAAVLLASEWILRKRMALP